jgi:hypothetical protein
VPLIFQAILLATPLLAFGQTSSSHLRVQEAVKQAVSSSGNEVVIVGSWFKGGDRYKDPLSVLAGASDHDMRVRVPPGMSQEAALARWQQVREEVTRAVRAEFGKDADRILATINVYPPRQLMEGVEDSFDATRRFRQLGAVPGLGFKGSLDGPIEKKFVEGLYGQGSVAWTQSYENVSGRLLYPAPAKTPGVAARVFTSTAESVNLLDAPQELLSAGGLGNTARQWGEHGLDALGEGDARLVAKYLERAERDLGKSARLAMVELPKDALKEIQALKQAVRSGKDLGALRTRLVNAFDRVRVMGQVMSRARTVPGPEQAALRIMLKSQDTGRLGELVRQAAQKVPLDKVLDGIALYLGACEISRAAGAGDPGAVLLGAAQFLAPIGPALAATLAQEVLTSARQFGYDLVANSQDAFDLLEGFFSAEGRADVDSHIYTLDQLVEQFREGDEERLRAFIRARSAQAADRDGTPEPGVAESIYQRCMPVLVRAWQARRAQLANEAIAARDAYLETGIRLTYSPVPAAWDDKAGSGQATIKVSLSDGKQDSALARLRATLQKLYGTGGYFVDVKDTWAPQGRTLNLRGDEVRMTFRAPGAHSVQLTRVLEVGGPRMPRQGPLVGKTTRHAYLDVEVGSSPPVASAPVQVPKPAGKLAALQALGGLGLTVALPNGTKGVKAQGYRENGVLLQLTNSYSVFSDTFAYVPLVWNGTTFRGVGGFLRDPSRPGELAEVEFTGEVDALGTRLLKGIFKYRDSARDETFFTRTGVTITDMPIAPWGSLDTFSGRLEGPAMAGHVHDIEMEYIGRGTGNNQWSYLGMDWSKAEGAYVTINFYKTKPRPTKN